MSSERVFIVGGTGNIGARTVKDLVAKNIPVTLYARTPSKVESLFGKNDLISIVQGDYSDLSPLKEGVKNHTRLFVLVLGFDNFVETKYEIAKAAYDAGVKQIVDISSFTVNLGWRSSFIGAKHFEAEQAMYNIPNRGKFVALRPGRFMANLTYMEHPFPAGKLFDSADHEEKAGWISTDDIGSVAAVVLSEDIEKHGDAVYTLIGDLVSVNDRAALYARLTGKEVTAQKITPSQHYAKMMESGHIPHIMAMDFLTLATNPDHAAVSHEIPILLGREPETLEQYITSNRSDFSF